MRRGRWRGLLSRRPEHDPAAAAGAEGPALPADGAPPADAAPPAAVPHGEITPAPASTPPEPPSAPAPSGAWAGIADQFALQLLVLAEHLRPALDRLEKDEDDADRLHRLYQVDHAVTRMRRAARDLRVLAGGRNEEMAGYTSSLVDVIRVAESSIERYTQISIGTVTDLAVPAYAADDVASLLAALLDNATKYSPTTVTVSAHLTHDGSVMIRIEDAGIGIATDHLATLNSVLAGPVPEVDEYTGKHTGFPVVHRLAAKHGIGVRLAVRQSPGPGTTGTIAMAVIPPALLCEVPQSTQPALAPAGSYGPGDHDTGPSARLTVAQLPNAAPAAEPLTRDLRPRPEPGTEDEPGMERPGQLPRRTRTSLRGGAAPRPAGEATPGAPAEAAPGTTAGTTGETGDAETGSAARSSFAADLDAFTSGDREARQAGTAAPSSPPPATSTPADDDLEEQ
ncbi:MAG: hypothetical protein GEV11_08655 [Streptosporangiales bacterium]|nr:hypothetical protein [Streptosporangiales bacterium]